MYNALYSHNVPGLINQFLNNVDWQHLDYLIIDTPPGTSDEHICLAENLSSNRVGVVIVTTPQVSRLCVFVDYVFVVCL